MRNLLKGLGLAVAVVLTANAVSAETISFGTLRPGSITNTLGQGMARVIQENSDHQVRVIPFAGDGPMLAAVNTGRADFGMVTAAEADFAVQGIRMFEGDSHDNVQVAYTLYDLLMGIFVRQDSGIQTLQDLRGKRYPSRYPRMQIMNNFSEAILASVGMEMSDLEGVPTMTVVTGADDFKVGRTDAALFALGAPKVQEVDAAVGGIRFLNVPNNDEALRRIQDVHTSYYVVEVQPNPAFAGVNEPTTVMAAPLVIVAGSHVDPDVVEAAVRAMHANKETLVEIHPVFRAFRPDGMARQYENLTYHPGAVRFYREAGIWQGE